MTTKLVTGLVDKTVARIRCASTVSVRRGQEPEIARYTGCRRKLAA
jgi:hypothetical protein